MAHHTPERSSVLFEDLTEGLVWPKLLRAGGLALRPERIGLGVAIAVLIGLIDRIGRLWHNEEAHGPFTGLSGAVGQQVSYGTGRTDSVFELFIVMFFNLMSVPMMLIKEYPLSTLVLGPFMLLVWAVFGGAISRSVMSEVSLAKVPAWPQVLGSAMRRWVSLFGAMLVPLVMIAVCYYLIAVVGLGMHVPVVDVLTAVLFGLGLVLGLFASLVIIAYSLGGSMLVPAVMAEGTDALDGVQRSLAYVWSRPIRTIAYVALLVVVGYIALRIAWLISGMSVSIATNAAQTWGPTGEGEPWQSDPTGTANVAMQIVAFWGSVVQVIVTGYAVSFVHTAGALQYLCLRRVCDGQEIGELWEEGA